MCEPNRTNEQQQQRQRQRFGILKEIGISLIVLIVMFEPTMQEKLNATTSLTNQANQTNRTTQTTRFVPHRFTSKNNITILHEVHDVNDDDDGGGNADGPILLNTDDEILTMPLPLKPVKKKPYMQFGKSLLATQYEQQPQAMKEYELHPVTFDFNLGDLEDLEDHESFKKGDLSSEERHLLRNDNDDGLTYTERSNLEIDIEKLLENSTGLQIPTTAEALIGNSSDTTTSSTTTTTTVTSTTPMTTTTTVGTYILKILKTKSSKKGRELIKSDDIYTKGIGSKLNSIGRYLSPEDNGSLNASLDSLYVAANYFQILTNLYDHFYWQPSEIRTKVRTGCGLEIQAYLTALHANLEWAQRAYDVSGRYRGQVFFGNDKWLGQITFCTELNNQLQNDERRHFEFEFFVADVSINLQLPKTLQLVLSIGECLPRSCSAQDVRAILMLDPHAQVLANSRNLTHTANGNQTQLATALSILQVRTVPGGYNIWHELRFQVFISIVSTLLVVVLVASLYKMQLNKRQHAATPIEAISAKFDVGIGRHDAAYCGRGFELFQMRTLNEHTSGNTETEIDVNGNKGLGPPASSPISGRMSVSSNNVVDVEKSVDKSESVSCAGMTGVTGGYETKLQLGLPQQLLLCFAFQINAGVIINIGKAKETHTSCLHGLRVISLLWTIMVHTYLQMFAVGENKFQRIIVERSWAYQIVGNATFSVDTFFFLSGLLATLLYFKQDNNKHPIETKTFTLHNFVDTSMMILYRYVRLTPVYLFTVFYNDFAVRQRMDSSVFQPSKIEYVTCRKYWWRNILYVNNFFPIQEGCMIWSWYMANDMQFFIMAAVLLAFSRRYFKIVVIILCAFLVSSWGVSGIISLQHHYTHKVALPFESFDYLYDKPWQRVGAYIIGMFVGYVLYKVKSPPKVVSRTNRLFWAGSLGLLVLVVFGVWDGELSLVNTAFYVGVGHSAYAFGLVWIVLSCCWGLAPTVNRILSCRLFWPISRLTYCTYLLHPTVMFILSSYLNGTTHLTSTMILTMFLGNAVISFAVAFMVSTLFEAPVIRLLKICFKK